jgi:23S rRNA pseudouridine955/2504/2580 synthase
VAEKGVSRGGVRHLVVAADAAERRLDNYLASVLGKVPKSLIYRIIRSGEVRVNGGRGQPDLRLVAGDRVRIPPVAVAARSAPGHVPDLPGGFERHVLWEDVCLLVLNKPAGIAVHGGTGLRYGIIDMARAARPEIPRLDLVHRLDRETSGCLLLAKDATTLRRLNAALAARRFRKTYVALLSGHLPRRQVEVDAPLDVEHRQGGERRTRVAAHGASAITRFTLLRGYETGSLVEVDLETGRTHQIRAHAAYLGLPLAGDERYADSSRNARLAALGLRRLFLHARTLEFTLARDIRVEAPLPDELKTVLDGLAPRDIPISKRT